MIRILAQTRAQQRAAGTINTALFDIVNAATGNGSLRAPPMSRVPGERSETRDLGATRPIAAANHFALRESSRWIPALVPFGFASLHSAGTRDLDVLVKRTHVAETQQHQTRAT
jgi:hypothetical protein